MKKFLCLVLALILALSVFSACGSNEAANSDDAPAQVKEEEKAESVETPSPAPSDSEEVASADSEAAPSDSSESAPGALPDVYIAFDATDNEVKISYHLEGCSAIKGTTVQQMDWSAVQAMGFRQCGKCKPPKYEGYID